MSYHHVAVATRDLAATHRFYTECMGFSLVKVVNAPTDTPGAWARHVFYETGGHGLFAVWDLHDDTLGEFDPAISTGLGLPSWVNHVAFACEEADLADRLTRWLDAGLDAAEIDHGFCRSIYTNDPNGILVEWCADTGGLTPADAEEAAAVLFDPAPPLEDMPVPEFHLANPPS